MPAIRQIAARGLSVAAALLLPLALSAREANAHTETDLIAVPAGGVAKVALKPTHGCSGSPTVEVAIRAPVLGATANDVEGWTATAEADGQGNTVLRWTGGSLPADETGSFTVTFMAPDVAGELLTFPSVQTCANGEDLPWIDGNPDGAFPAPRLLILPAGTAAAESIEDIPLDAPGRELLVEIIDIDGTTSTTIAPTSAPSTAPTTTAESGTIPTPSTTAAPSTPTSTDAISSPTIGTAVQTEPDSDGGTNVGRAIAVALGALVLAGSAAVLVRRRREG
jgi:uncharacterized protein YcnI